MAGTLTPVTVIPFDRTFHGEKGIVFDDERPFSEPCLQLLVQSQYVDGLGVYARKPQSALFIVLRNQLLRRFPFEPRHRGAKVIRQARALDHHVMPHHLLHPR